MKKILQLVILIIIIPLWLGAQTQIPPPIGTAISTYDNTSQICGGQAPVPIGRAGGTFWIYKNTSWPTGLHFGVHDLAEDIIYGATNVGCSPTMIDLSDLNYNATSSNLPLGVVVYDGTTPYPSNGSGVTLNARLKLEFLDHTGTDGTGVPIALDDALLSEHFLMPVTGDFQVNVEIQMGPLNQAAVDYFDCDQGNFGYQICTSFEPDSLQFHDLCDDPVAVCQNATVELDASGNVTLLVSDVDGGSSYDCGLQTMTVEPNSFDCGDIGGTPTPGNPVADIVVAPISYNQHVTANAGSFIGQSFVPTMNGFLTSIEWFTTAGIGETIGAYNVSIYSGNPISGSVIHNETGFTTIASTGAFPPTQQTVNFNNPISLSSGLLYTFTIEPTGSTSFYPNFQPADTYAPGSAYRYIFGSWSVFSYIGVYKDLDFVTWMAPEVVGNPVTLTVTDIFGNSSTCSSYVTVEDNLDPWVTCSSTTVQLDANGEGSILPSDVLNSASDNCGIVLMTVEPSTFDCGDVNPYVTMTGGLAGRLAVGVEVVLTVTDESGNSTTCSTMVTVEDNVDPEAYCDDATVVLDANGNASILPSDVDDGSSDACGMVMSVNPSTFDCQALGTNTVILTVMDNSGNTAACDATVTVQKPAGGLTYTWTGNVDTDWTEAGNWDLGCVPEAGDGVVIPVATNQPVVGSLTNTSCGYIQIQSGATLGVEGTLNVDVSTGNAVDNAGTLNVEGSLYYSGGDFVNDLEGVIKGNGTVTEAPI